MKEAVVNLIVVVFLVAMIVGGICFLNSKYNSREHSDDIKMTEWVSPDGVHY